MPIPVLKVPVNLSKCRLLPLTGFVTTLFKMYRCVNVVFYANLEDFLLLFLFVKLSTLLIIKVVN